jgi:hypothetical protein
MLSDQSNVADLGQSKILWKELTTLIVMENHALNFNRKKQIMKQTITLKILLL